MLSWTKRLFNDWLYRRRYHSHGVRDLAKQIEWRLSLNHQAVDTNIAYKLSQKLNEMLK